jgi:hypothetical protein
MFLGSARVNEQYSNDINHVNNVYFTYTPNYTISPSLNLLNMLEVIEANRDLNRAASGVVLRLDQTKRVQL